MGRHSLPQGCNKPLLIQPTHSLVSLMESHHMVSKVALETLRDSNELDYTVTLLLIVELNRNRGLGTSAPKALHFCLSYCLWKGISEVGLLS